MTAWEQAPSPKDKTKLKEWMKLNQISMSVCFCRSLYLGAYCYKLTVSNFKRNIPHWHTCKCIPNQHRWQKMLNVVFTWHVTLWEDMAGINTFYFVFWHFSIWFNYLENSLQEDFSMRGSYYILTSDFNTLSKMKIYLYDL